MSDAVAILEEKGSACIEPSSCRALGVGNRVEAA